ncbi:MAG: VWA domain-containing protein, partial [Sandaracinaceae bacterium]
MKISRTLISFLCVFSLLGLGMVGAGCDTGGGSRDAGAGDADLPSGGDADGDTITDDDELREDRLDTAGDGIEDWRDPDSDGDGLLDIDEAGDARLDTPPIDSDLDGAPDYRDTDSDHNGYTDGVEGVGDIDLDG